VAADGKSGDGCGIMLQFPEPFLRDVALSDCGFRLSERFAAGLVFFSPDPALIERGQGDSDPPPGPPAPQRGRLARRADPAEFVGEQAGSCMPAICQVFVNACRLAPARCRAPVVRRAALRLRGGSASCRTPIRCTT
jgi:glutamate synthase (NADPH/NADH) large chain